MAKRKNDLLSGSALRGRQKEVWGEVEDLLRDGRIAVQMDINAMAVLDELTRLYMAEGDAEPLWGALFHGRGIRKELRKLVRAIRASKEMP